MLSVSIEGLVLSIDSQGEMITASNQELEINFMIRHKLPNKITDYRVVVALFPDDSYKYLYLELELDGKISTFELASEIIYSGASLSEEIVELKLKMMRMSIKNYYYQLYLERRLAELVRQPL